MSEVPPSYAQYPRNESPYGTAAQLQALMEAYYGYSRLFLIHILLGLVWLGLIAISGKASSIVYFAGIPAIMLAIGFLSYPLNKKIAYGANWSQTQVVLASVMMAFTNLCLGIVGYIIIQSVAANHIKRYGVRSGCTGLRKKAVKERIAELEAAQKGNAERL